MQPSVKVLIPVDISCLVSDNPFDSELCKSLLLCGCKVDHGKFWLNEMKYNWDIVNFQWPEYLLDSKNKYFDYDWLESRLSYLKRNNAKLVCTVHNLLPHKNRGAEMIELYKLLYSYADGFIHFGSKSVEMVNNLFPDETLGKPFCIIPHGNYRIFGQKLSKSSARKILGLTNKPTFLVIGALRLQKEYQIVCKASAIINRLGGQLLFCSTDKTPRSSIASLSSTLRRFFEELFRIIRHFRLKLNNKIIYRPGPIAPSHISTILSASDVVLIPRTDSLNSGNVPLAFSYECIVLGPNVGNIGECLIQTGNPTFSLENLQQSLENGIINSFNAIGDDLSKDNYSYSEKNLDWKKIGPQYISFYKELLAMPNLTKNTPICK